MRRLATLAVPAVFALLLMLPAAATAAKAPTVEVVHKECHAEGTAVFAVLTVSGFAPNEAVELDTHGSGTVTLSPTNSRGEVSLSTGGPSPQTLTFTGTVSGESVTFTLDCAAQLPTETEECKDAGFKEFTGFTNQGQCVSFVATDGKNEPGKNLPTP